MKIKSITLENFANYGKVHVSFDENVTYLIGKNGSGKSTLGITAIWFMFQSVAEKSSGGTTPLIGERFRFIGPNGKTANGEMILHDEKTGNDIKVIRKLTKTGTDLSFEAPDGVELDQAWLTDLFNIFLIAPKKFCELSAKDQAKALGIDTKQFDQAIAEFKKEFTEINAVYRSYGELPEVEKIVKVDVTALQAQKDAVRLRLNEMYLENKKANEDIRKTYAQDKQKVIDEVVEFNEQQSMLVQKFTSCRDAWHILRDFGCPDNGVSLWLDSLKASYQPLKNAVDFYPAEPKFIDEIPDDTDLKDIDQQIINAGYINERALLYEQYLEKKTKKGLIETSLKSNKDKQAIKEAERLEYIKAFKFPFSNLTVGEDGELLLNGKPIKAEYFSTGELLKIIPVLISTTQPELKYVFLQDFNLMDEDKQKEIEEYLTGKGFQLVVEMVGKTKVADKNCILLRDNCIVEDYAEATAPEMAL